jgi:hypothetical protein
MKQKRVLRDIEQEKYGSRVGKEKNNRREILRNQKSIHGVIYDEPWSVTIQIEPVNYSIVNDETNQEIGHKIPPESLITKGFLPVGCQS